MNVKRNFQLSLLPEKKPEHQKKIPTVPTEFYEKGTSKTDLL